jgi:hypothetical protein
MGILIMTALMVSLFICAFVGLDVAMRPARYLGGGAPQGLATALDLVSQRMMPNLDRSMAYRLIGAAFAMTAIAAACGVAFGFTLNGTL